LPLRSRLAHATTTLVLREVLEVYAYTPGVGRGEKLTREEIVHVALGRAIAHGLASLSTRTLADDLGVTPMALYRHVRNKDEIVDMVVDSLLDTVEAPAAPRADWRLWMEEQARSLRGLFQQHPIAVEVFARRPVTTPAALARLASAVEVLEEVGFGRDEAVRAFAAVHTYTVGFCTLEAARGPASGSQLAAASVDVDAAAIRDFVGDAQFGHGLRALLAGLGPAGEVPPR
jgi:AcrR family transcriptional regulator